MTNAGIQSAPTRHRHDGRLYRLLRAIKPLRATVRFVRGQYDRHRPLAWRLEGRERMSGTPLAIVFAGHLENKNYIAHLAFAGSPAEQSLGRQWLWRLVPPERKRKTDGADLRIVELYESQRHWFGARFQFFVPIWIGSELDLQRAVTRLHRSKNARYDLRRMRREETTCEVTHSRESFEHFYANMYLPYIKNRYGNRAFPMSHEDMVERLGSAELFFAKVRGERVAGHILIYENDGVRAWSLGIKDGDSAYIKAGAIKALDYLTYLYLAERGHKVLHLGGSRPFLLDGVLRHKKGLGVRVSDHTKRYFSLHIKAGSAGAQAFVVNNPFIYVSKGTYRGALFIESDLPLPPERLGQLHDEYHMDGLAGISLFDARAGGEKQLAQIPERFLEGVAA